MAMRSKWMKKMNKMKRTISSKACIKRTKREVSSNVQSQEIRLVMQMLRLMKIKSLR